MAAAVIDATVGGASANSFATEAEADTYHESLIQNRVSSWVNADSTVKIPALITAARIMDERYEWRGFTADEDQRLLWPRNGILDVLKISIIAEDVIPQRLKDAQSEFARIIIEDDPSVDNPVIVQGLTALTAGPVSLKFKDSGIVDKVVPNRVRNMIPEWWGRIKGSGFVRETGTS